MKLFKNNKWVAIFSIISIVLLISSFLLPPTGMIDPSVIASVGELFAFAALWTVIKAIDKGVDATLSKGDMQIEINNKDDKHFHHPNPFHNNEEYQ